MFSPFWKHHNGVAGFEDWEEWFRASERRCRRALKERDTVRVLRLVFDRLYVLRNRIVHGGATWNSRVNRDQVRDGAAILAFLMPVFVDVMMDNPHEDWGVLSIPSCNRIARRRKSPGRWSPITRSTASRSVPAGRAGGASSPARRHRSVVRRSRPLVGRPPEQSRSQTYRVVMGSTIVYMMMNTTLTQ